MSRIYAISDDILTPDETILSQVNEILKNGVKFFQYRSKKAVKDPQIASEILALCKKFQAKFIINDDVNFASCIGAKCVHIGADDMSIKEAKEILGEGAFIGVSCYNDINSALKAQKDGAGYVAFGSVFESRTKPDATLCPIETIKKAKEILHIPICAIGGINVSNIAQISALNVELIAVINAIYKPNSISKNLNDLKQAMIV
ncbi:MAG: thiamine phosphate synthase [Campylobacter sp.]|nr:thiamine phosphate synthase [Campylobacter sp.]